MKLSSTLFASMLAMSSALASPCMDDARSIAANMTHTDMTVHENGLVGPSATPLCKRGIIHPVKKVYPAPGELVPFGFEIYWYKPDGLVYHKTEVDGRGGAFYCWLWGRWSDSDDKCLCKGYPCWWAKLRWANDRGEQFSQEGFLLHWQKHRWSEGQKQALAEIEKAQFKEKVIDRVVQQA